MKIALKALFHNKYWILANIFCFMFTITNGFIAGFGMYYMKSVFQDTSYYATVFNALSMSTLITLFISPLFQKRLGKRNTMLFGTIIATAAFIVSGIVGTNLAAVTVCSAIKGFGSGLLASGCYGAVADTIDYGEWKFGVKTAGIGFSGVSCGTKIANGLASVFLGWIIKISGYNGDLAIQSPRAVLFTNASMNYLPAIFYGITIICLIAYKLDKLYPQIQKELDERRKIIC